MGGGAAVGASTNDSVSSEESLGTSASRGFGCFLLTI